MAYGPEPFAVIHFDVRFGSRKEAREYVEKVLRAGVRIGGATFHFLGHSNEQLKTRTCVLFRSETPQQVSAMLSGWVDFSSIASVAKRAKRTALLFSRFRPVELPEHLRRYEEIEDLLTPRRDAKYTDGCGYCSLELDRYLARRLDIRHREARYVPCVFQIRFLGYKGVVVAHPGLDQRNRAARAAARRSSDGGEAPQEVHLQLRKSMCKFKLPQQQQQQQQHLVAAAAAGGSSSSDPAAARTVFGICDYSKPYKYGYLNSQAVMLLSALGVPDCVLEGRQEAHLEEVARLMEGGEGAVRYLLAANKVEEAELLVEFGLQGDGEVAGGERGAAAARQRVRQALRALQQEEVDKLVRELPPLRAAPGGGGGSEGQGPLPPPPQQQQERAPRWQGDRAVAPLPPPAPAAAAPNAGRGGSSSSISIRGRGSRDPSAGDDDDEGEGCDAEEGPLHQELLTTPGPIADSATEGTGEQLSPRDPEVLSAGATTATTDSADGGPSNGAAAPPGAGTGVGAGAGPGAAGQRRVSPRIRVRLEKSRRVFGVADPSVEWPAPSVDASGGGGGGGLGPCPPQPQLYYGQCFFQPLVDGRPESLVGGHIVMIRNPCYDVGDVRVLEVVDLPSCRHIVDALVLPVHGDRPTADEASGGDLDGDTFLVIWDEDIVRAIKAVPSPPYPPAPERQAGDVGPDQLIRYFSGYQGALLGRIDRLYHTWAGLHPQGPACPQCRSLSQLFCRGVDSVSTGQSTTIPPHLQLPPERDLSPEERRMLEGRVWRRMEARAEAAWRAFREVRQAGLLTDPEAVRDLDARGLMALVRSRDVALSEFELLRLMKRWCEGRPGADLAEWALQINFGSFTAEQRLFALSSGLPRQLVTNALGQSALLQQGDLAAYQLGGEKDLHWKLLAEGTMDHPLAFDHFYTALTCFQRKLLLLQMAEPSQVIAVYLNECFPAPGTYNCEQDMLVFAFAGPFHRKQRLQSHNLWLDLTSNRIQIYRNAQTSQSFLWLHKGRTPVNPQAPVALTAPAAEMRPNVHLYRPGRGGGGSGDGNGGQGQGRSGGIGGGGRGRGRGRGGSGAAAADAYVRVSIATIELDRQAFADGQLRKVTKEPLLRYELYVVSDREPLARSGTWHLGGTRPDEQEGEEGEEGAAVGGVEAEEGGCPLAPEEVAATPEEEMQLTHLLARAANGGAVEQRAADMAARLAGQGKLAPAMRAARLARHTLQPDQMTALLRAAGRLHNVAAAGEVVGWMLEQAGALPVLRLVAGTGALTTCPELVIRIWAAIQEAAGSRPLQLGERDLELLLRAAVGCARRQPEFAEELVRELVRLQGAQEPAAAARGRARALPLSLTLELLQAAAMGSAHMDGEAAIRICRALLPGLEGEKEEEEEEEGEEGGGERKLPSTGEVEEPEGEQHQQQQQQGGGAVERYCHTMAAALSYEMLEEVRQTDQALAERAAAERWGAAGWRPTAPAAAAAAATAGSSSGLLWDFVAKRLTEADEAAAAAAAAGGGRRRAAAIAFGAGGQPSLQQLARRRVEELRQAGRRAVGGGGDGGAASAGGAQVLELYDLVSCTGPEARPQLAEDAAAPLPPGSWTQQEGAGDADGADGDDGFDVDGRSGGDGAGGDSDNARRGGGGDGGGGGGAGAGEYDDVMGSRTAEGHDAYVAPPGVGADGLGLTAAGDGGGGSDGHSLELRRCDGLLFASGGDGADKAGIRVGDLVRLSDMRSPAHLLHLHGGCSARGLPLSVEGTVTAVGGPTITVCLPWLPGMHALTAPAAADGGGGGVGLAAAANGSREEAPPRRWRLQRLGNVITYQRGMQALLRCQRQLASSAHPFAAALTGARRVASPLEIVVSSWDLSAASRRRRAADDSGDGGDGGSNTGRVSAATAAAAAVAERWVATSAATRVASASPRALAAACGAAGSNDSQRAAVEAAASGVLSIVHGPPGTGKTSTIAALLAAILLNADPDQNPDQDQDEEDPQQPHGSKNHAATPPAAAAPRSRSRSRRLQLPVLVTAETNVAVDNILDRLLRLVAAKQGGQQQPAAAAAHGAGRGGGGGGGGGGSEVAQRLAGLGLGRQAGDVVRVGDSSGVSPQLRRYCLEAIQGVRNEYGYNSRAVRKTLRGARIVFATCAGAGSPLLDGVDFPLVVVDEASQATEATTLIPLTRGSRQAVLVGDHCQLGPLVQSEAARRLGAEVPLFERLQGRHRHHPSQQGQAGGAGGATAAAAPAAATATATADAAAAVAAGAAGSGEGTSSGGGGHFAGGGGGGDNINNTEGGAGAGGVGAHMLDTQYRMHPDIAAFPAGRFYGGRLRNGANTPGIPLPGPLTQRVTFVHVDSWERATGHTFANVGQADEAVRLVGELLRLNRGSLQAGDIGIITPYRAMVQLLKSRLERSHPSLEIATVDGFQGREKRVVLLVTVRANAWHKVGFVAEVRRLNVAITRAAAALVVLGHRDTLRQAAAAKVAKGKAEGGVLAAWLDSMGQRVEASPGAP
ncbi:hypothetical protein PLESTM_000221100 [Pleodorina starrii]|nr:hypothetical protein PLESTM_000221100 [Pleodorina starrii]